LVESVATDVGKPAAVKAAAVWLRVSNLSGSSGIAVIAFSIACEQNCSFAMEAHRSGSAFPLLLNKKCFYGRRRPRLRRILLISFKSIRFRTSFLRRSHSLISFSAAISPRYHARSDGASYAPTNVRHFATQRTFVIDYLGGV
jgi:hypothetical protein